MQLVAYLNGERVDATQMARDPWRALDKHPNYKDLVLLECGLRASRVTRGVRQFFRHYRTADCTIEHKSESEQHLAMKRVLQDRINARDGWRAEVEHAHPGRKWIADVMAMHTSGRRLAFEVQLSDQSEDEYIRRSQRYTDDGVDVVWVIPRDIDWVRVKLPVIVTGFGKSSDLPGESAELMHAAGYQPMYGNLATVGFMVDGVLHPKFRWRHGTPMQQLEEFTRLENKRIRDAEAAAATAAAELAAKRLADEEAVRRNAEQEALFVVQAAAPDPGVTPTVPASMNIWASVVYCVGSGHRMLIWRLLEPPVRIDLRPYRPGPENLERVREPVTAWLEAEGSGLAKANIVRLRGPEKRQGFACPECNEVIQGRWVAGLPHTKWALVASKDVSHKVRTLQSWTVLRPRQDRQPEAAVAKSQPAARLPAYFEEADWRFIGPRRRPPWMSGPLDGGGLSYRLAAKEAHTARMEQLRADPRYLVSPNGFRFECTDCGGMFEDDNEGIHAGARCTAPGARSTGWR